MPRKTRIYPDQDESDIDVLKPAIEVLNAGGVIAGPTETSYGLMAAANNDAAIKKIFALKGREFDKPLLLLIDHPNRVDDYADNVSATAKTLMKTFWPGRMTILCQARPGLNLRLVGPSGTVALRQELLKPIRNLVQLLNTAVSGTSANPSSKPPATTAQEVEYYFGDTVDLILDGGPCSGDPPSTLVDSTSQPPKIIRQGILSIEEIRKAVPDITQ